MCYKNERWGDTGLSADVEVLAKIILSGDPHLSSKNRGAHNDYPSESLYYYNLVGNIAEQHGATHSIDLGDFSYGRFHTLEYRMKVEDELKRQLDYFKGNKWGIKGNHDSASYGKTEFEYYLSRKLFKGSEYIKIGNVNINMVDFDKYDETEVILGGEDEINVIVTHGYFKFSDSNLPPYGDPIILDNYEKWYGADYIICGHIHEEHLLEGAIHKEDGSFHECVLHYLPSLPRPSYLGDATPTMGTVVILTVYANNTMLYETIDVPLLPMEQSFNLALKDKQKEHRELVHVDVTDVVNSLANHQRVIGDPEVIIMSKEDIPEKYRLKAIELLKNASK